MRSKMKKYSKPQIYVANNSRIAKKLDEKYVVAEGDLGLIKRIEYGSRSNDRLVNLEYSIIPNLHEYEVRIIDMQEQPKEMPSIKNEDPNGKFIYKVSFPKRVFDPRPLVMNFIKEDTNKDNLTIFFADSEFVEDYQIVKVLEQHRYLDYYEEEYGSNSLLHAKPIDKEGNKLQHGNHKLSDIINKYATEYKVIFELPKVYNQESGEYLASKAFRALLTNQDGEVVSYIGFNSKTGLELVLPVCKNKEQLIEELFSHDLPELMPEIFPESQEFVWSNNDYYKSKETLELEESIEEIKKNCQDQIKTVEGQVQEEKEKNIFLIDLLTETGDKLVEAVVKYFEWLGFDNIVLVDEKEVGTLREDIQIMLEDTLLIIEVKGIGGTSTDAECAQVGKHRHRREKEYPEKEILPIYIVNHQRYMDPRQRAIPPFSKDQIDYAENDERGLLTTWDMYKKYKLIEEGVFMKEEVRGAFQKQGLLDLTPVNIQKIGKVSEYYPEPQACIVELGGVQVSVEDEILCNKDDVWLKGKVKSLKVNDSNVDSAQNGEVGLVADIKLEKGYTLYKRNM